MSRYNYFCHSCLSDHQPWIDDDKPKKRDICPACGKRTLRLIGRLGGYAMHTPEWMKATNDMNPQTARYNEWRKTEGEKLLASGECRIPPKGEVEASLDPLDAMATHRKETAIANNLAKSAEEATAFANKVFAESKGNPETLAKAKKEFAKK